MVSNLLVEIAIYNFDVFHSALTNRNCSWLKIHHSFGLGQSNWSLHAWGSSCTHIDPELIFLSLLVLQETAFPSRNAQGSPGWSVLCLSSCRNCLVDKNMVIDCVLVSQKGLKMINLYKTLNSLNFDILTLFTFHIFAFNRANTRTSVKKIKMKI